MRQIIRSARSRPLRCGRAAALLYACLLSAALGQSLPALENAPPIRLGDSETLVRSKLNARAGLYAAPFSSNRFTLKAADGLFVDFHNGKVVEIDSSSQTSPIRIGGIAVGSDLATARTVLAQDAGALSTRFSVTAAGGEIVEIRGGPDQKVDVIAVIGDRSHVPANSTASRVVLQNSGRSK